MRFAEALVGGCAQLVILGTGHDTRAYRAKPGFLLWRATLSWQRRIRSALAPHDLTHVQFVLLASLWWLEDHEPEPPTQASLAAQAETDRMMTSQVLRKLEARDLLERIPDPNDNRARRLRLTPAGRELVGRALDDFESADADYFAPLAHRHDAFLEALVAPAARRGADEEERRR